MSHIKLLTIDVWDTLLRRQCHPECIKLATARFVWTKFYDFLKPCFDTPALLYSHRLTEERKLTESNVAKSFDAEFRFEQLIYNWLSAVMTTVPDDDVIAVVMDYELARERAMSFPDAGIRKFVDQFDAGLVYFLSDFYMGSDTLANILQFHGLLELCAGGMSSSDELITKKSGRLYNRIRSVVGIEARDHLHIGDNFNVDVQSALKSGANAIQYLPPVSDTERHRREFLYISNEILFLSVMRELSQTCSHDSADHVMLVPILLYQQLKLIESSQRTRKGLIVSSPRQKEFVEAIAADFCWGGVAIPVIVDYHSCTENVFDRFDESDWGNLLNWTRVWSNKIDAYGLTSSDLASFALWLEAQGGELDFAYVEEYLRRYALPGWVDLLLSPIQHMPRAKVLKVCRNIHRLDILEWSGFQYAKCLPTIIAMYIFKLLKFSKYLFSRISGYHLLK